MMTTKTVKLLKKYFKPALYTVSIVIVATLVSALWLLDASQTALHSTTHPDAYHKDYKERPPVALVTYAHGHQVFFKNQQALLSSAANKGFDRLYAFKRSHIDPEFYDNNQQILSDPIGAGYWLWKPYFILKVMEELPEDSIILYADSGVILKKNIQKLIDSVKKNSLVLVGHGNKAALRRHVKKEAYEVYDFPLDEAILNDENIWGFFIGIRNTKENRVFVKKWLEICQIPKAIMNAPLNREDQDKQFEAHAHDQALLSVLAANRPHDKIVYRRNLFRLEFGVQNYHRHADGAQRSPLVESTGLPRWLSNAVWNNPLLKFFRADATAS